MITVKSLWVKQLDLLDPKLEDLAELGANDSGYQKMIRHIKQGIKDDQLEDDSELKKLKGDFPNLGLQSLSKGKLWGENQQIILRKRIYYENTDK